jgi:hypothetical protein
MKVTEGLTLNRNLYRRAAAFGALHDRSVSSLVAEALTYWLDTVGEAMTEEAIHEIQIAHRKMYHPRNSASVAPLVD